MEVDTGILGNQGMDTVRGHGTLENLLLLSIDHKSSSLDQIGLLSRLVPSTYQRFYQLASGIVVLSTCNRFEVYLDKPVSRKETVETFTQLTGHNPLIQTGVDVIRHLFRVASGIESKVIGENEILGQVREAWKYARENSYSTELLDLVFMYALKTGRRVREETGISEGVIGYPKAALIAGIKEVGSLRDKNVIILGAGKAGRIILEETCKHQPRKIFIANRSRDKALFLSNICRLAEPISLKDIGLYEYDIAFIAINDRPDNSIVESLINSSNLIIDISIPPVAMGNKVIDVFQLEGIVEKGVSERKKWIPITENIVREEISNLLDRMKTRNADIVVSAVSYAIENIIKEEMDWITGKIPSEYHGYIKLALNASLKKMAHPLIMSLRELARLDNDQALNVFLKQYSRV
ncbi:MAG: hypothetical protein F7B59_02775 [Desulfurococcales archaeon]|nr:hypothetical protein [Desulfurococcales archaeon]